TASAMSFAPSAFPTRARSPRQAQRASTAIGDLLERMKPDLCTWIHQTKVSTTPSYQSIPRSYGRRRAGRACCASSQHETMETPMSSTQTSNERTATIPSAAKVGMKLEVVVIPVSDVDRAKRFYEGLGWRLDADFPDGENFRVVQLTPPGSQCSIHFG